MFANELNWELGMGVGERQEVGAISDALGVKTWFPDCDHDEKRERQTVKDADQVGRGFAHEQGSG